MNDDGISKTILSYKGLEESIKGMTLEEKLPRIKRFLATVADHPEIDVSDEAIEQMRAAIGIYERAADHENAGPDDPTAFWFML